MHIYISGILAIFAIVFMFSPETFISKNTTNTQLKMIYDNNIFISVGCMGLAYYIYNNHNKVEQVVSSDIELPSYEQATSE
jgi:hypothetical protein